MSQQTSMETEKGTLSPTGGDSDEIKTTIRRRAAEINREELRTAFDRLEAEGGLTTAQEHILQNMAASIVDGILSAPESMLEEAEGLDRSTREVLIELFDPKN